MPGPIEPTKANKKSGLDPLPKYWSKLLGSVSLQEGPGAAMYDSNFRAASASAGSVARDRPRKPFSGWIVEQEGLSV